MDSDNYSKLIFQNHSSTDFGMYVEYPFNLVHPVPDIDASHIKGRNGDFLQGNPSYQNVTETFNVVIERPIEMTQFDLERRITNWLRAPVVDDKMAYQYLKFDYDPDYIFSAIVKDPYAITWDTNDPFRATGTIPFYCEPFQYRIDGITFSDLPNTGVVYNTEGQTAIPDWHFVVNGMTSFTLNVNGLPYTFDNMEGEFWVSGETGDTYDLGNDLFNNQTHFPNLSVPVLEPGKNTIDITTPTAGSILKAEYKPKWRRLI